MIAHSNQKSGSSQQRHQAVGFFQKKGGTFTPCCLLLNCATSYLESSKRKDAFMEEKFIKMYFIGRCRYELLQEDLEGKVCRNGNVLQCGITVPCSILRKESICSCPSQVKAIVPRPLN